MKAVNTWKLVEIKMSELRAITDQKWKDSEWELAALGERVLRTAETSKVESEALRQNTQALQTSMQKLIEQIQYQSIFKGPSAEE